MTSYRSRLVVILGHKQAELLQSKQELAVEHTRAQAVTLAALEQTYIMSRQ